MSDVISADGAKVPVNTSGGGPGLVLLHGGAISDYEYRRLAARLAEHFTVHTYNRRGRPNAAPLTGTETPATDIHDLDAVLTATGSDMVFGHSGGGFVAMQAGLHLPIKKIAVYDPAVAVTGVSFPGGFLDEFERLRAEGKNAQAMALMGREINQGDPATKLPFWLQVLITRSFLHTSVGKRMADGLPTVAPEVSKILAAQGPATDYAEIEAEVLLSYGQRSAPYFQPICESLAAAIPNARALAIPKASHNTANIAPKPFVNALVDFLS